MSGSYRRRVGLAVCVLLGMLLVGCGGGSNLPEATRSASLPTGGVLPTESRTASRSIDVPSPSRTRDDDRTASSTATVSDAPAPATTAESSTAETAPAADEESTGSWWWLLVAAIVVVGIVWFLIAGSRHRKWDAAFATGLLEARWAADTFTPSVTDRAASANEVSERWRHGKPRLDALLAELGRLADTASGAARSGQVARVSGAAAALSDALAEVMTRLPGDDSTGGATRDLDESRGVAQARADALLDAITSPGS